MATSGQILTTVSGEEIIQEALELVGALGEGEAANLAQLLSLKKTLNALCVTWQAAGLNLFAVTPMFFFLNKGQAEYTVPGARTVSRYLTSRTDNFFATGVTGISVQEATDNAHDTAGVLLDDGDVHWSAASISGTNITLTTPLPADSTEGAPVFTYKAEPSFRFMKALHGTYRDFSGYTIPMEQMARNEYDELSRKDSKGVPLQFYVDTQSLTNAVYIWPTALTSYEVVRLDVQRQLDTIISTTDDVSFPSEWFLPLASNLAYISSAKYGLPQEDRRFLKNMADEHYEMAEGFDFEWGTSIEFRPDTQGG